MEEVPLSLILRRVPDSWRRLKLVLFLIIASNACDRSDVATTPSDPK